MARDTICIHAGESKQKIWLREFNFGSCYLLLMNYQLHLSCHLHNVKNWNESKLLN